MRVYIYEESEAPIDTLCKSLELSPTKLTNLLFNHLLECSPQEKAKLINEIFKTDVERRNRFNKSKG